VVKYRRVCYQEAPGVETGARQALMEVRSLPNSFCFGRAGFVLSYRGQTRVCFKCQGAHILQLSASGAEKRVTWPSSATNNLCVRRVAKRVMDTLDVQHPMPTGPDGRVFGLAWWRL